MPRYDVRFHVFTDLKVTVDAETEKQAEKLVLARVELHGPWDGTDYEGSEVVDFEVTEAPEGAELTPPPADDVGQFRDASDLAGGPATQGA